MRISDWSSDVCSSDLKATALCAALLFLAGCGGGDGGGGRAGVSGGAASGAAARLLDGSDGADWPAFGRTYGEPHSSPLDEVNRDTVSRLGLAWSVDLPLGNSVTGPVAVDGFPYTATGYSVVRAFDARSAASTAEPPLL